MANKVKEPKRKERRLLEKVSDSAVGGGLARALGSTDFHTRERGLQALTLWLSGHANVTEKDMLRLWKALFYCFWHSDKGPVQVSGLALICGGGSIGFRDPFQKLKIYFDFFGCRRPRSRSV